MQTKSVEPQIPDGEIITARQPPAERLRVIKDRIQPRELMRRPRLFIERFPHGRIPTERLRDGAAHRANIAE